MQITVNVPEQYLVDNSPAEMVRRLPGKPHADALRASLLRCVVAVG
jgi:hypothetical protein